MSKGLENTVLACVIIALFISLLKQALTLKFKVKCNSASEGGYFLLSLF